MTLKEQSAQTVTQSSSCSFSGGGCGGSSGSGGAGLYHDGHKP